jgi:hypothetical protein
MEGPRCVPLFFEEEVFGEISWWEGKEAGKGGRSNGYVIAHYP